MDVTLAVLAWLSLLVATGGLLMQCLNGIEFRRLRPCVRPSPPSVAACVAMRNESTNARACIASLLRQPEVACVVVCDDGSEDETVSEVAAVAIDDPRIVLLSPCGSGGKREACAVAAAEAIRRAADILFFTDADVRLERGALAALLEHKDFAKTDSVSAWPRTLTYSFWDELFSQTLLLFLLQALPLRAVRISPDPRFAAANGQLFLVDAGSYARCGGHRACAGVVEDVALAKQLKSHGSSIALADATLLASTNGYGSLRANICGYGRSLYCGAGRWGTAAFALWQLLAFALPWILWPCIPVPALAAIASGVFARAILARKGRPAIPLLHAIAGGFVSAGASLYLASRRSAPAWRGRSL